MFPSPQILEQTCFANSVRSVQDSSSAPLADSAKTFKGSHEGECGSCKDFANPFRILCNYPKDSFQVHRKGSLKGVYKDVGIPFRIPESCHAAPQTRNCPSAVLPKPLQQIPQPMERAGAARSNGCARACARARERAPGGAFAHIMWQCD